MSALFSLFVAGLLLSTEGGGKPSVILGASEVIVVDAGRREGIHACDYVELVPEPLICVSTSHLKLAVAEQGVSVPIDVIARASRSLVEPLILDVAITGAWNMAGVKLTSGQYATKAHLKLSFSNPIREVPLLRVETSPDNAKSGVLGYEIYAGTAARNVKVRGVPLQVSVAVP